MYIYRERDTYMYIYIYIRIHTYIHIYIYIHKFAFWMVWPPLHGSHCSSPTLGHASERRKSLQNVLLLANCAHGGKDPHEHEDH